MLLCVCRCWAKQQCTGRGLIGAYSVATSVPCWHVQLPPVDKGPEDCHRVAELAVQNLEEKLIK